MDSESLTKEQAATLLKVVGPAKGFLHRLRERMVKTHFPPDDRLFHSVCKAHDAMHDLWVRLHYLSCDGAGRKKE